MALRGKTTGKKGTAKKPSRSKASEKPTARKVQTRRGATSASRKPAAARKTPSIEAVARKIVRATTNPAQLKLEDLYADSCTSYEAGSTEPAVGLAGLAEKLAWWESITEDQTWKPRNVWTKGNTIAIQWDAEVKFRDGRTIQFDEVAVHEVRGGKIVAERFYYDPRPFAPPEQEAAAPPQAEAAPPPEPEALKGPEPAPLVGSPPVDPIDL
jgi:ketosteroid isomerase-like protein